MPEKDITITDMDDPEVEAAKDIIDGHSSGGDGE